MTWLELIRLRSPEAVATQTREFLKRLVAEIQSTPGLAEVALYSDVVIAGDFALHLVWEPPVPARKTETGHRVAEHLRTFGLVDHHTWKTEAASRRARRPSCSRSPKATTSSH